MDTAKKAIAAAVLSLFVTGLLIFLLTTQLGVKIGGGGNAVDHVLALTLSSREQAIYSLYFDPDGQEVNWVSGESVNVPQGTLTGEKVVRFTLPDRPISRLRLKFGDRPDTVIIRSLALMTANGNTCTWKGSDLPRFFNQTSLEGGEVRVTGSVTQIASAGAGSSLVADPFEMEIECEQLSAASSRLTARWWVIGTLVFGLIALVYYRSLQHGATLSDLALLSGFVLLLALPLLTQALGAGNTVINAENRALSSAPGIPNTIAQLKKFPNQWSAYFNDHFGGRNEVIFWSNRLKVQLLHTSPLETVVIGKDRWIFYTGERSILDYQGFIQMDDATLKRADDFLREIKAGLDERGIAMLVVVAPDKHTIYPEYLPDRIHKASAQTRLDQFLEYNQSHTNVDVLDLRPLMLEKKAETPYDIYFKTDTHWNELGGFYAYQGMIQRLSKQFPILVPRALSDYELTATPVLGREMAKFTMLRAYFMDQEVKLTSQIPNKAKRLALDYSLESVTPAYATEIDDSRLPKAIMFHDSFADYFTAYFSQHFERIVYVRSYQVDWTAIDREQPDVVIIQVVERRTDRLGSPQNQAE
jgi:hypothetical protein